MPRQTKPKTNDAFRQWTRGVSLHLAMGRRQVHTLVALQLSQNIPGNGYMLGGYHKDTRHFVTSTNVLVDRGLVVAHVWQSEEKRLRLQADAIIGKNKFKDFYELTRAGELVIELLKEAGIYEEVKADLEKADKLKMRIA